MTPLETTNPSAEDDLPPEINFSRGTHGKYFRPGQKLQIPVHLDDPLQSRLTALAEAKGVELSALVNDLLRKDLDLIEAAQ